jgi:hypothetical protein
VTQSTPFSLVLPSLAVCQCFAGSQEEEAVFCLFLLSQAICGLEAQLRRERLLSNLPLPLGFPWEVPHGSKCHQDGKTPAPI